MYAVQAAVVFRLHGTPREASGVFIAGLLPNLTVGPFAGHFTDRWNARRTMVACDLIRAVLVALLIVAKSFRQFCAISFAVGCASAFFTPSFAATLPNVAAKPDLLRANARLQQSVHVARLASPVIAGTLVAGGGETLCYAADSCSFLASALLLTSFLRFDHVNNAPMPHSSRSSLTDGWRCAMSITPVRDAILFMTLGVFATGCFSSLVPVFVRDGLRLGPAVYGVLGTFLASGTLAGSLAVGKFARTENADRYLRYGLAGVGLMTIALAISAAPLAAYAMFFCIGAFAAIAMTASVALVQSRVPAGLCGRVTAISTCLTSAAQLSATAAAAIAAGSMGVRPVYALSGLLLLLPLAYRCSRR